MKEDNNEENQLIDKLDNLLKKHESLSRELNFLREEITRLKSTDRKQPAGKEELKEDERVKPVEPGIKTEAADLKSGQSQIKVEPLKKSAIIVDDSPQIKADLEKFIGENLINKIGIAITVIGVAIGAKYAIDHQLISPLTRILLGYLAGIALLVFAFRLKKKYKNFSAVLLSGSMAIMYFITYAAFSFYSLLPQAPAFVLMVIITIFSVTAAMNYDKQIIALFGLVGAYAVPYLLNEGSEYVVILFSYMTIINIGILFIAFRKYWKLLYYSSFLLSWLMYLTWFGTKYHTTEQFTLALIFLSVFFVTFYLMFLVYKVLQKEKFNIYDIIMLLLNSFIFYGVGYNILAKHNAGEHLLGLFTLCNAIVHFLVSLLIYRQKLADKYLFFLISGLAIVFITIAIPVQLDGHWITLLWAGEAALLFWIGRTKKVDIYEILSYFLIILALISIIRDWSLVYNIYDHSRPETRVTPLFNVYFLTSLLFIFSIGFINFLHGKPEYTSPLSSNTELTELISYAIPGIFLIAVYFSFKMEISTYWNQLYKDSLVEISKDGLIHPVKYFNKDISHFKTIWIINYSFLYFSLLSLINVRRLRNRNLGLINLALNSLMIVVFLTAGLYILSELRDSYLNHTPDDYFQRGIFNIGIRYVSYIFAGIMLASAYSYIKKDFLQPVNFSLQSSFDILLYTSILWIVSSEMITWMDILHSSQSYKLGLSILWGIFALLLIVIGIWKKKKHLRIAAIVLFTVTLLKLFFYDISHLGTIPKTIIFISLGIILLIISFLYIKYRNVISGDGKD
jgi:hypothetical protein